MGQSSAAMSPYHRALLCAAFMSCNTRWHTQSEEWSLNTQECPARWWTCFEQRHETSHTPMWTGRQCNHTPSSYSSKYFNNTSLSKHCAPVSSWPHCSRRKPGVLGSIWHLSEAVIIHSSVWISVKRLHWISSKALKSVSAGIWQWR